MNCITVDDEPLALDLLEDFIKKVPFLKLIKKCNRAADAIEILQNGKIDLIFLDIRMPNITGIQLVKTVKNIPPVIFTTAYTDYAVEGFELDVLDYLVKPFTFERFLKAANKAYSLFKLKNQKATPDKLKAKKDKSYFPNDYIFVKSEYKNIKVNLCDILYIEGLSDYVKIHLSNGKKLLSLQSLKNIMSKLPDNDFVRIHSSFIISLNKVDSIQKNKIFIGEKQINIGEKYKTEFFDKIDFYN